MRVLLLAVLLGSAAAITADFASKEWKERPVTKVVNLLKEMQSQLQKEQDDDQELYDGMACWCESNDKSKTKAIADAQQHTLELQANINEGGAKVAQLTVDIDAITKEIAANEDALNKATAIRAKDAAEFHEEEKNAIQSITGLKNAVITLGKHHDASAMVEIQHELKRHLGGDSERVFARLGLSPKQSRNFNSFLQQSSSARNAEPASGEIFGVLKGMKESFEQNFANSQSEEASSLKAFLQLKKAKTEEINAGSTQNDNKKAELADTSEKLANDRTDNKETLEQLERDQYFMVDLKERCGNMDAQWAHRSKVRNEEVLAISEALSILQDDEARDVQARVSFVQLSTIKVQRAVDRAVAILSAAATKNGNPKMSALAVMMKSDVFAKVKQAIDEMTVQLKKEGQDEVKHRDFCIEEYHQNQLQTDAGYATKADLETHHEDLKSQISALSDGIEAATSEIAETQLSLKRASEDRQKANKEFQMTVTDQRATQQILDKALTRLKDFYAAKGALVQVHAVKAPPAGFKDDGDYKKSGGASGVMNMMAEIIQDSKQVEKEATKAEQDSQQAYEALVADSNGIIKSLNEELATKGEAKAKADEDRIATEADIQATFKGLTELHDLAETLHMSCDFTMRNFDARQSARLEEIDALAQAKAILSGADM